MTPVTDILARNRDLALAEAETCMARDLGNLASHALGQATAYAESIRIIEAAAKPEQFRCGFLYLSHDDPCGRTALLVAPDGTRYCNWHAPTDTDLTISEHDDQRAER